MRTMKINVSIFITALALSKSASADDDEPDIHDYGSSFLFPFISCVIHRY